MLSRRSLFRQFLGAVVVAAAATLPIKFGEDETETYPRHTFSEVFSDGLRRVLEAEIKSNPHLTYASLLRG